MPFFLNVPLMKDYVEAIRASGLKSIYYYCGNPMDRLEPLLAVGADAVHFEESKKNFVIDIDDVVAAIEGRRYLEIHQVYAVIVGLIYKIVDPVIYGLE